MAKNLREKFFLVKIGARKKGFLKPKSGQKLLIKLKKKKNSQHWGEFKKINKKDFIF